MTQEPPLARIDADGRADAGTRVSKGFESTPIAKLPDAPVSALQGVSEDDAERLRQALNIKTIRDLGTNRYFLVAQAIVALADPSTPSSAESERPATSVSIYLESDDRDLQYQVVEAVQKVMRELGYGDPESYSESNGSFIARWTAKVRDGLSSTEVADRLIRIERAVDVHYLEKAQAEVDAKEAEAVAALFKAIQDVPTACVRAGSLLVLKYQERGESIVLCRTLTQKEISLLDKYPEIQLFPKTAMQQLGMVSDQDSKSDPD